MRKLIRIFFVAFTLTQVISSSVHAQCPDASFVSTAAVCAGQAISLNNTTTGGVSYEWDFCGGDMSATPAVLRDTLTATAGPIAITPVFDGTNWYAFLASADDATVVRYDYGNSLDNIPTFN